MAFRFLLPFPVALRFHTSSPWIPVSCSRFALFLRFVPPLPLLRFFCTRGYLFTRTLSVTWLCEFACRYELTDYFLAAVSVCILNFAHVCCMVYCNALCRLCYTLFWGAHLQRALFVPISALPHRIFLWSSAPPCALTVQYILYSIYKVTTRVRIASPRSRSYERYLYTCNLKRRAHILYIVHPFAFLRHISYSRFLPTVRAP